MKINTTKGTKEESSAQRVRKKGKSKDIRAMQIKEVAKAYKIGAKGIIIKDGFWLKRILKRRGKSVLDWLRKQQV